MPELPEVEAARRAVEQHCKGGLISRAVVADDTTVIEGMLPFDMQRTLLGKRIMAAHRKGKQLWLEMDEPPSVCFQFGMAGAVYIKGVKSTKYVRSAVKDEDEWPSKYSKVLLVLNNGVEMSFTDKRRFARVRLLQNPTTSSPISELGPDAYTELPDENSFAESVIKKKTSIKAVLLDQSFLAGIGNWIADEVLYQSRIHPEQPASTLTTDDCKRLRQAIKEVLDTAIEADADPSKYPEDWIFHHREKRAASSAAVNGKKIEFITVGGRTSAYVPELQKYDGIPKKKPVPKKKTRAAKESDDEQEQDDDNEHDDEEVKESTRRGKARVVASESSKVKKQKTAQTKKNKKEPSPETEEEQEEEMDEPEEKPKRRGRPSKATQAAKDKDPEGGPQLEENLSYGVSGSKALFSGLAWPTSTRFGESYLHPAGASYYPLLFPTSALNQYVHGSELDLTARLLLAGSTERTRVGARLLSYILRRTCFF